MNIFIGRTHRIFFQLVLIFLLSASCSRFCFSDERETFDAAIRKNESGDLELTWSSVPGIQYYVYEKENITDTWSLADDMVCTQTTTVWPVPDDGVQAKSFIISHDPVYVATFFLAPFSDPDFNFQQARNFVIEKGDALPGGVSQGRLFFRTTTSAEGNRNSLYADIGNRLFDLKKDIRNVKAFGAKGDGIADDTLAIQTALDDLTSGAGLVFLPPGVYLISSPLIINAENYVVFEGSGSASVLRASSSFTGNAIITNTYDRARGMLLRNFCIEGNPAVTGIQGIYFHYQQMPHLFNIRINMFGAEDCDGILWERVESGGMENIVIEGTAGHGIYLRKGEAAVGVSNPIFRNILITDGGYTLGTGILIEESNTQLFGARIENASQYGIQCSEGIVIAINVKVEGSPTVGMDFQNTSSIHNTMFNCSIINPTGVAVNISGSYGVHFRGGIIDGDINISADSHLTKFDRVRETENTTVTDLSQTTNWDSIKDSHNHSAQQKQSPSFARIEAGTAAKIFSGPDTPEGAVAAPAGSIYLRTDGGTNTTFYVKESGTGPTGWVGK